MNKDDKHSENIEGMYRVEAKPDLDESDEATPAFVKDKNQKEQREVKATHGVSEENEVDEVDEPEFTRPQRYESKIWIVVLILGILFLIAMSLLAGFAVFL